MKNSKFLFVLALLLFVGFSACKDDDATTTPEVPAIKTLNGYQKLEIGESTITLDGASNTVQAFDIESIDDVFYIVLILNEDTEDFIAASTVGQSLDGKIMFGQLDGDTFGGGDFIVNEVSENVTELTGQLVNSSGDTKEVTILFDMTSFGAGESSIVVEGEIAKLNGDLGSHAYNQILDLNADHPNVHTILFEEVPGSVNDEVNVQTGRLVREAGYTTWVKSTSEIASGGVDLFCAGKRRIIEDGAVLGVHSWCCGENGEGAADIPADDSQHDHQTSYFSEMLGDPLGKEFYFFTINAAPFDGIHNMTKAEIEQYRLATE